MIDPSIAASSLFVLLTLAAGSAPQEASPARRLDLRANSFTWSAQDAVALAQDAAGASVVTWHSRRQQAGHYGVYARRVSANGELLGDEVQVNQYTRGSQTTPSVAIDAGGAVWFAWESLGQDGDGGGIFARRFDRELETSTVEVLVNDVTAGHQAQVALACDAAGNALVVWTSPEGEAGRMLRARRLVPDGAPMGPSFVLSQGARATLPTVVAHADGYTVAWSRADAAGKPEAICALRLAADGTARGEEHSLYAATGRQPVEPVLATDAHGALAAAWLVAEGEDYVPHVQRFEWDAEAAAWTGAAPLSFAGDEPGYTSGLEVELLDDGRMLLAWTRYAPAHRQGRLLARYIEANGEAGEVFSISRQAEGAQRLYVGGGARRMVAREDGRIAVAWNGDAGSGDANAAHLTLHVPEDVDVGALATARAPLSDAERFEAAQGAVPHEPPVRSGGPIPREAFLGPENLGGPDFGFVGITQTSLTPPDVGMAAGPGHVVEIVNGAIAWFRRDGTFEFQQDIDGGSGFWSPVGANGFIFDPEVIFDPDSRRFMAMANERAAGAAFFLLAVSDDDDPNGNWHKYRLNVTAAAGDTDIDSPNLGVDDQAIYLSADFFGPDKYLVFIVEKAPTLSGGVPATRSLLHVGSQSWGIPVMSTPAPAYYMVEAFETPSSSTLRLHAITDPLGSPADTTFDLAVPTYQQPENPPQAGTSVRPETFEARIWSCFFRGGKLYVTHHQGAARVLQRWYEIDMGNWPTSGTPSLVQSGTLDPGGTIRTFFGSIGADAAGNIALTYARSSPTEFISMSRSYRESGMAPGTMTGTVISKNSTGPDFSGRWGDYSSTVADPDLDGVFWGAHQYQSGGWATWVATYGPCQTPTTYCTGKLSSAGTTPAIGFSGEPSLGSNNFQLTLSGAAPNNNGIYFFGPGTDNSPFFGGTLCVGTPITRSSVQFIDGAGNATAAVPIVPDDLGLDRYFQFWYRDPAHPDGTGVGLSDALEVTFCP